MNDSSHTKKLDWSVHSDGDSIGEFAFRPFYALQVKHKVSCLCYP